MIHTPKKPRGTLERQMVKRQMVNPQMVKILKYQKKCDGKTS